MSVMFFDIDYDDLARMTAHRPPGATYDAILYADDTICISMNAAALTRYLHAIEEESDKYGLKLNNKKM